MPPSPQRCQQQQPASAVRRASPASLPLARCRPPPPPPSPAVETSLASLGVPQAADIAAALAQAPRYLAYAPEYIGKALAFLDSNINNVRAARVQGGGAAGQLGATSPACEVTPPWTAGRRRELQHWVIPGPRCWPTLPGAQSTLPAGPPALPPACHPQALLDIRAQFEPPTMSIEDKWRFLPITSARPTFGWGWGLSWGCAGPAVRWPAARLAAWLAAWLSACGCGRAQQPPAACQQNSTPPAAGRGGCAGLTPAAALPLPSPPPHPTPLQSSWA